MKKTRPLAYSPPSPRVIEIPVKRTSSFGSQSLTVDLSDIKKAIQQVLRVTKTNLVGRVTSLYALYHHFVQKQKDYSKRIEKSENINKILNNFRSNDVWFYLTKPQPPSGKLATQLGIGKDGVSLENKDVKKNYQTFQHFIDKLKEEGKGFSMFESRLNKIWKAINEPTFDRTKVAGLFRWFIVTELSSLKGNVNLLDRQRKNYEEKKNLIVRKTKMAFTFPEKFKCITTLLKEEEKNKAIIQFFDRSGALRAAAILTDSNGFVAQVTALHQLLKAFVGNSRSRLSYILCLKTWPHNLKTLSNQLNIPRPTEKKRSENVNLCINRWQMLPIGNTSPSTLARMLVYEYLLVLWDPTGEQGLKQIEQLAESAKFPLVANWIRNLKAFKLPVPASTFFLRVCRSQKISTGFPQKSPNFRLALRNMRQGIFKDVNGFAWGLRCMAAKYYVRLKEAHYLKNDFATARSHQSFERFKDKLASFVTYHILSAKTVGERANLIAGFIKVSKALIEMGELNTAMAIYLPIGTSSHITNLVSTWKEIGKKHKESLTELQELASCLGTPSKLLQFEKQRNGPLGIPFVGICVNGLIKAFETPCSDLGLKQQHIEGRVTYFLRNQRAFRQWLRIAKEKKLSADFFRDVKAPTLFDQMRLGMFGKTQELAQSLHYLVVERYVKLTLNNKETRKPVEMLITKIKQLIGEQITKVSATYQEKGNLFINFLLLARELGGMGEPNLAHGIYQYLWVKLAEKDHPQAWKYAKQSKLGKEALTWFSENVATFTGVKNLAKTIKNFIPLFALVNVNYQEKNPSSTQSQEFWRKWYQSQKKSNFPVNLFREIQTSKRDLRSPSKRSSSKSFSSSDRSH